MIKRILLALDLDNDTPIATRYAINLAKQCEASLTGLAVVDTQSINPKVGAGGVGTIYYADMLRSHMTEESRKKAGILLERFNKIVEESGIKHATSMEEGVPYQRIIDDMKYHDLLVIGRESHFFYNRPEQETDTLADIVKNSSAPTLVVTESYYEPLDKVVIAHDGSMASARSIQWFVQLEPYGKDIAIDLVHVCKKSNATDADKSKLTLHLAADLLKAHGYRQVNQHLLDKKGSIGEMILDYIRQTGGDLVIMGAHSVSALRRLTFGSTTHDLVTNSPVPLFLSH